MSEPISALRGDRSAGYVTVAEDTLRGMIQLKGDLSDALLQAAVTEITGGAFPEPLSITLDMPVVAWMAPDEVLILIEPPAASETLMRLRERLADLHHLALDVSDMRAAIRLEGAGVREVLAKVVPIDMATLTPGTFRRTRLGQVPAAIWLSDETTGHVLCFRSVARYVFDLLAVSARKGGEIHAFEGFRAR